MSFTRKSWFYKMEKKTWSIKYTLFIAEVSCYFHISLWNLLLSARGLDICLYICLFIILIENTAIIVKYSNCRQASDYMVGAELGLCASSVRISFLASRMPPFTLKLKITESGVGWAESAAGRSWMRWYGLSCPEGREHTALPLKASYGDRGGW